MSEHASVAVIIAAYNAQDSIRTAIESVINEAPVTQVIVVDDCSSDDTYSVVEQLLADYEKLSLYSTPENSGPAKARNIALGKCTAQWVTVLDSDDFIEPGRFEKMLKHSEGYQLIADDQYRVLQGQPLSTKRAMMGESGTLPRDINLSQFIESNISQKGKSRQELGFIKPIIDREFLVQHQLSYQENMRLGEDYELYCRCLALGGRLKLVEACGYVAIVRANSLSGSHSQHDLIQLRDCDYKLAKELTLSDAEQQLLSKHASSIDNKVQWISFYKSLKKLKLLSAFKAIFSSFSNFLFISEQLKEQIVERLFKKRSTT